MTSRSMRCGPPLFRETISNTEILQTTSKYSEDMQRSVKDIIELSLEVKLPTIGTDEEHSQEEAEPGRNSDVEKVRREKMQVREKIGKSQNTVCFQLLVAPEGRKGGSLKRRVGGQLAK